MVAYFCPSGYTHARTHIRARTHAHTHTSATEYIHVYQPHQQAINGVTKITLESNMQYSTSNMLIWFQSLFQSENQQTHEYACTLIYSSAIHFFMKCSLLSPVIHSSLCLYSSNQDNKAHSYTHIHTRSNTCTLFSWYNYWQKTYLYILNIKHKIMQTVIAVWCCLCFNVRHVFWSRTVYTGCQWWIVSLY